MVMRLSYGRQPLRSAAPSASQRYAPARARQNSIGGNLLTRRLLRAVAFCRVWTQSGLKIRCSKTW